ncbi:MAG TPA: N-6 DNA methylase [Gemmatimonadales bacterium]|nr:N-6 DNA methylase [Gemmatimonadales bacterium]
MDLEGSLRSIQSLSDLPRLVAELGHQPLWEEVPQEGWSRSGGRQLEIIAVGQTEAFPWFGIESSSPDRDAVALARRIFRRGKVGLVMALDTRGRRLAVAVAFDRCPTLAQQLDCPNPEALSALGRLAGGSEGGALAFAARAAEALAAEPVSTRFFRAFRSTLDRMAAGLRGTVPPDARRELALLQLTRVLFLYFIQAKGWLNGRERFLAEEIDGCLLRRRRIHRDLLRPLFFGTLNQPLSTRSRHALAFGRIPFLNGGLFEPHPLERRHRSDASNELWRDAFDGLFERFHFTISEQRDPGRIAPDMLGRVFEGVMDPEDRHTSGTFYTPAALVEQILDACFTALLSTRLSCTEGEAERRLRDPDPAIIGLFASVTVLDPAVGSGAFLLSALERLARFDSPETNCAARKRRILRQNLFGVDRNAAALRVAQLRLWLAVVADDSSQYPEEVTPLPNIDCLIRQGDSLFDPAGFDLGVTRPDPAFAAELGPLRQQVIGAAGAGKQVLVRRLRRLEMEAMSSTIRTGEQLHCAAIRECLEQARLHDLFGHARGLDGELRRQLDRLRSGLRALRQARRRLDREGELPWFHYQSHFADVFERGGFDLVIGNPPWLRSEAIPVTLRRQLTGRYRWWKHQNRSYGKAPDLAVAFLERALELSASRGIVAMLVPAKITTAGYGVTARHALASSTTIHVVADLTSSSSRAFEATVYPLALIVGKSPPPRHHRVRTELQTGKGGLIRQSELRGGAPWILVRHGLHSIVAQLQHDHPSLGASISCHLGVKTGLNRVFLNPPDDVEPELVRLAIRGRDVRPFRCRCRVRLLWTHDPQGCPYNQLPRMARAYVQRFERELRARRDYQGGPLWTVFRTRAALAPYRVVWPDLSRRMSAVALTARDLERIPLNTCYVAPVRSAPTAHALAAWLNSTWMGAVARLEAAPASGGFARFNAQVVARLPLPPAVLTDPDLTRFGRQARTGALDQTQLDDLAARHLNLSSSTQGALRAVVDGCTRHSR